MHSYVHTTTHPRTPHPRHPTPPKRTPQVAQCNTTDDCTGDLTCVPSGKCYRATCSNFTITQQPCASSGICAPSNFTAVSASLRSDLKGILITLNSPPKAAQFPCSRLFNASTAALIGSGASCQADSNGLMVMTSAAATIMPGATMAFARAQGVLVDDATGAPYNGSVVLQGCAPPCAAPVAVLAAPAVRGLGWARAKWGWVS